MTNLQFFIGAPAEFKEICLIYPVLVKDIVSNKNFHIYTKLLTYSQEEIEDEYVEKGLDMSELLTPFEYILNNAYHNLNFRNYLTKAFMFFTHEPVIYLFNEKEIAVGDLKELKSVEKMRRLKEEDFFEFQNMIREAAGLSVIEPPVLDEDPRIKAIKAKARYRDKVKMKKGLGLNLETVLTSICCMGLNINPLNIGELSYASIQMLLSRYQEKEKYQLDIESLLAGADSKKIKPKYWIRNLKD